MKKFLALFSLAAGTALAQQPVPSPLDAVPPPLAGALMDLYMNYQQNRPRLPLTQEDAAVKAERIRERNVKVASGAAIGSAIGAMVAKPNDRGKAAVIGAVAGALAAWIVEHEQSKRVQQAATAPRADPNETGGI